MRAFLALVSLMGLAVASNNTTTTTTTTAAGNGTTTTTTTTAAAGNGTTTTTTTTAAAGNGTTTTTTTAATSNGTTTTTTVSPGTPITPGSAPPAGGKLTAVTGGVTGLKLESMPANATTADLLANEDLTKSLCDAITSAASVTGSVCTITDIKVSGARRLEGRRLATADQTVDVDYTLEVPAAAAAAVETELKKPTAATSFATSLQTKLSQNAAAIQTKFATTFTGYTYTAPAAVAAPTVKAPVKVEVSGFATGTWSMKFYSDKVCTTAATAPVSPTLSASVTECASPTAAAGDYLGVASYTSLVGSTMGVLTGSTKASCEAATVSTTKHGLCQGPLAISGSNYYLVATASEAPASTSGAAATGVSAAVLLLLGATLF